MNPYLIILSILYCGCHYKVCMQYNYPRDLVKLVFSVGDIKNDDNDDIGITAVVPPL